MQLKLPFTTSTHGSSKSRELRRAIAAETIKLSEKGSYKVNGQRYTLEAVTPTYYEDIRVQVGKQTKDKTIISFEKVTSFEAIRAHQTNGLGCLNFASAKRPGGGFKNGATAQEESLAYASNLILSLEQVPEFYKDPKPQLYTNRIIYSPNVTFFRDDNFNFTEPLACNILTMAAPNAADVTNTGAAYIKKYQPIFLQRIHQLLYVFQKENCTSLILGAWGCGVFNNNVELVSKTFKQALACHSFKKVIFAIPSEAQLNTFKKIFSNGN